MATSCSDNELSEVVPVRDYQTDALVLSKFVDINKTIGEYYINENKKILHYLMFRIKIGKNCLW